MGHRISTERLEASAIGSETELTVAQRNVSGRVIPLDIVACHEGMTVNATTVCGQRRISCVQSGHRHEQ